MDQYTSYFIDEIKKHPARAKACQDNINNYIKGSSAGGGTGCHTIHSMIIPKIFSQDTILDFQQIVAQTYGIFAKIIDAYQKDAKLREAFHFTPQCEELILADRGYHCQLPIARFDFFYQEDTRAFKFCEINTDGTSAMNENRELILSLEHNDIYQDYKSQLASQGKEIRNFEYFDSWVKAFLEIYQDFPNKVEMPHVAIVDFLENAYMEDFIEFQKHFQQAGISCEICDIRNLAYHDGVLYSPEGTVIHAIYRRAVTSDILSHLDEVSAFIQAYKDQKVCLIGSFATQIIHNKQLFIVLHQPVAQQYLTAQEIQFVQEHVPYTASLTKENAIRDLVIDTRERWILKPLDSYAASGIYLGYDYSQDEWKEIVEKCQENGHYLYQEFYLPYQTMNMDYSQVEDGELAMFHHMTGIYVYNGKMTGIYSRCCRNKLIAGQFGGKELPSLYIARSTC